MIKEKILSDNEKTSCIELIQKFILDFKENNVKDFFEQKEIYTSKEDILENFFFGNLYGDSYFGGSENDSDSRKVVKAIHFLYYSKILKECEFSTSKPQISIDKDFNIELKVESNTIQLSGDTLNTFNTLFWAGCGDSIDHYVNSNEKRTNDIYEAIARKTFFETFSFSKDFLLDFYREYQRIGNFMLLPKGSGNSSINRFRGDYKREWKDYFDLFLADVKNYYDDKKTLSKVQNDGFKKIVKSNENYFRAFNKFKDFVKFNCLDSFFVEENCENELKNLRLNNYIFYHWMRYKKEDKDEMTIKYMAYSTNYVKTAKKIIELRSKEIIEKIKDLI